MRSTNFDGRFGAIVLLLLLFGPAAALSQVGGGALPRPGETRPELPDFEPDAEQPGSILPPLVLPQEPDTHGLSGGLKAFVHEVRITGNTVMGDEELSEITRGYEGRELGYADLVALRDSLTLLYTGRGYVTSGAVLPDQSLRDGVVEVWIVEGRLEDIRVTTDGRFRPSYFESRIARRTKGPVQVQQIEETLQILQQDDRIKDIEASLIPGERRGESILEIRVHEAAPYRLFGEGNNYEVPLVGAEAGHVQAAFTNLTGFGDSIQIDYTMSEGLDEIQARYKAPVSPWDTELELHFRYSWADVVDQEFDELRIRSTEETYGITVRQPLYRSVRSKVAAFITGEYRRSQSFFFDEGFAFVPGPNSNGVSHVTVLRFGGEFTFRGRRQVFAARSTFSFGLDAINATDNPGNIPDSQFFVWLGQLQWARRLSLLDAQLIGRFDIQLSDSPLLGMEQFAMGGWNTVRGYRQNQLVRDDGMVGSLELRIPVLHRSDGGTWLELGTFVDAGYSWNGQRHEVGKSTLVGIGVNARLHITDRIDFNLDWAEDIKEIHSDGEWNLQDVGVYAGLTVRFP